MLKSPNWCLCVATTLLFLLVLTKPVSSTEVESWSDSFNKGEQALQSSKPKDAEASFRRALTLVKKQSKNKADVDKCMQRLAATLALIDKTAESRKIYLKLLNRVSSRHGSRSKQVEPILMALGSIQESLGNHNKAMYYYNRALRINEKNYGTYSPAYAGTLSRIGRCNRKMGKHSEARMCYKQSISILSKNPNKQAAKQLKGVMKDYGDLIEDEDNSNQDLINDFQNDILKNTESNSKKLKESVKPNSDSKVTSKKSSTRIQLKDTESTDTEYSEQASLGKSPGWTDNNLPLESQWQKQNNFQLKVMRQQDTDENRQVSLRGLPGTKFANTLNPAYEVVSDTIFNQGRYDRDESQYKRKIAIDIDALGPKHPSVANDLNALAQLYIANDKFEEARPLLTKALAIYSSTYGLNNILSINTLSSLAKVEFRLGEYQSSAKHYRLALNHSSNTLGPNSIETAKILNGLAYLYFYQGKLKESATFYKWAVSSTESSLGDNNPLLAACLKDYAKVLRRLGQDSKAKGVESRANSILAKAN